MPGMPAYAVMPPNQPAYPPPQRWTPPAQPVAALPPPPAALAMPPPPVLASAPPRFKARGVAAEPAPPVPVRIALPSPEALGIKLGSATATAPAPVDWNQVHARLERLGIVRYEHGRLPEGGFRVSLAVQTHQVEATGATEAAAVLLALDRAEGLVAAR